MTATSPACWPCFEVRLPCLQPLVDAWKADQRYGEQGRDVIGAAMAWRQADALRDAGIERTYGPETN